MSNQLAGQRIVTDAEWCDGIRHQLVRFDERIAADASIRSWVVIARTAMEKACMIYQERAGKSIDVPEPERVIVGDDVIRAIVNKYPIPEMGVI